VPVRPSRPALAARYDRRRAEVITAAARHFARRGYDQTTVAQLTEAMGLAAGGLYHYFRSKEELLIAICDALMEPLLEEAEALLAEIDDPREQLRELVRLWVAHVIEHRDHMLVFQQERHVIERGAQWKKVRDARKRFERCWPTFWPAPGPTTATTASPWARCWAWSTTPPSGTGRTAG